MSSRMTPGLKKNLLAGLVLGAGLLCTVLVADQARQAVQRDAVAHFSYASDQVAQRIEERLWSYALLLQGAAGLFEASDTVSRSEWRQYVAKLRPDEHLPGVLGIGFSAFIAPAALPAHIARVRAEGFPHYTVFPAGEREAYSAIVYLEPLNDRNQRAFGYDMYADAVRRKAMRQAADSGRATLSARVQLVQESGDDVQPGVLIYMPVYARDQPTDTVAERRAALRGWAYSPYRMYDLMDGILADWQAQLGSRIRLSIHDGQTLDADLLFNSAGMARPDPQSRFFQQRRIDFNGRSWLLAFDRPTRLALMDFWPLWLSLAGGLVISGLLFGLVRAWLGTRADAQRIAERLTADIRDSERLLHESEYRWKFALEGSNLGVWDWDIPAGKVHESQRYKEIIGYAGQWLSNGVTDWQDRIHADDRLQVQAAIEACLSGRAPQLESEYRLRHHDGHYLWVLARGMVVERDGNGRASRMLGTLADIGPRKALEQSLRQSQSELLEAQRMARVGHWSLDLASSRVHWSEEVYRLFGLDPQSEAPVLAEQERLFAPESWQRLSQALVRTLEDGTPYEETLEIRRTDGSRGWMRVSGEAVRDGSGIIGLRGVTADITLQQEARLRSERLQRLYAALSACNSAVVHCRTEDELLAAVCRIVVESAGLQMAWVGLLDADSGRIVPVQAAGEGTAYLDGIEVSVHADDPHGQGPSGTACRENRAVWSADFAHDPTTAPWHASAAGYGWVASAALPLSRGGKAIGVLNVYSSAQGGWDDAETRGLLEEMAADIGYALDKFDSEAAAHRHQAGLLEAEQRFQALVQQSIAGAYIIQGGRFVYVNPRLAHILGYPDDGQELLGVDPQDLVSGNEREHMQANMVGLLSGAITQSQAVYNARQRDGTRVQVSSNSSLALYRGQPAIIGLLQDMSDKAVAEAHIHRYVTQLEHIFLQTVSLATTLSEMRDPYTAGHEQRVAEIAVAIGGELGLDDNTLEGLRVGGYLHDVGKMRVPTDILSKPGRLTESEYALVKEHARAGYEVLKDVEFPWPVAQIALQHHERMDGSGYPQGLKGEAILLEARITAVADVVESMASHRPYRPGLGLAAALAEIEQGRGTAYDPAVVDACLRLFRDKGYALPDT